MIIYSGNDILEVEDVLDPDGMLYYTFYLKPPVWVSGKEYIKGDIVSPTVPTGYYYVVSSSGISGLTEPVWATSKGGKTEDGTVSFKAVDNNAYISANGSLSLASFVTTNLVPITNSSFTAAGMATVQLGPVPDAINNFELTLSVSVDSGHATNELDDRTIKITVGNR